MIAHAMKLSNYKSIFWILIEFFGNDHLQK